MTITSGSIEIIDTSLYTSDGIPVNTPDVNSLPAALTAMRGLTDIEAVTPIPTMEQEVPKFTYKQVEDGFERVFGVEKKQVPVADAVWTAKTPGGRPVTVYFRETRVMSPDDIAAAVALAQLQDQSRVSGE